MSTTVALLISAVLIVINGFFVAVELGFVASRRTRLASLADEGAFGAKAAVIATSNVTRMLFAAQLGITVASLILGFIAEEAVAHIIESLVSSIVEIPERLLTGIGFATALVLVVFVHTVFGEMVPKNLAIAAPETTSRMLAPLHLLIVTAVRPIIFILNLLARPLLRLAGVVPNRRLNEAHTPEELVRMLDDSHEGGLLEQQEHALITGALDFGDLPVGSVMINFDDIVTVDRTAAVASIEQKVVEYGHSRIPITGSDGASILGFVHSKDLFRLPDEAQFEPLPLEIVRRMLQVGVDDLLVDVLVEMQRRRTHMALVQSPNGDVEGMVTLEDVLEELVGEIYDETD